MSKKNTARERARRVEQKKLLRRKHNQELRPGLPAKSSVLTVTDSAPAEASAAHAE